MRPIDADVLWKDITSAYDDCEDILEIIDRQHTIEPRPRGRWVKISPAGIYECSNCGKYVMTDDINEYEFCHGCGADMRQREEGIDGTYCSVRNHD